MRWVSRCRTRRNSFRKPLSAAAERLARVRTRLTRPDPRSGMAPAERAGEGFLEACADAKARADYRMRVWDPANRVDGELSADLVSTVAGEKSELDSASVAIAKSRSPSITPETTLASTAVSIWTSKPYRDPNLREDQQPSEGATDEEFATAASFCAILADGQRARIRDGRPAAPDDGRAATRSPSIHGWAGVLISSRSSGFPHRGATAGEGKA